MVSQENVLFEVRGQTGIVRLNNPPQNSLAKPEFVPLNHLQNWIYYSHLKGLLITGAGRHFSSGAEIDGIFSEGFQEHAEQEMQKGKELLAFISLLEIPVFCAVKGVCFGGGLEIALACHYRVADPRALFAFPEVNHGLMPGLGGTQLVSETMSAMDALKMLLGGDMVNAEEALKMKLIDGLAEDPENFSVQLLKKMTEDRPLKVINSIMKAIHNTTRLSREQALKEETRMFCELARQEGLRRRSSE
ncbi:MAG: enoyl-CoA hydratase/isomerase family protein [Syntrophothermus sp.]